MKHYLLLILPLIFLISSCYYDSQEDLYPQTGNCDTTNISYNSSIKPIIDQYCVGCHNTSNPLGGIDLSTYDLCVQYGQEGSLYGSMLQNGTYSPMPKNSNKVDDCTLSKIQIWINKGYPN
jgi:hypothetical protein